MADGQLYRVRVNGQMVQVRANSEAEARQRAQQAISGQRAGRFETVRRATYQFGRDAADVSENFPFFGGVVAAGIRAGNEIAMGDRSRSATPGALGAFAQGRTFGLADEAQGGLAAATQPLRGAMGDTMTPGQAYRGQTDAARADLAQTRREAPLTAAVAELAGAATGLGANFGSGFVRSGQTALGRAGRAAAVGAPAGAAYGAASAEGDLIDRAVGAGVGGIAGAAGGFGGSLGFEVLGRGFAGGINRLTPALRNAWAKISRRGSDRSLTRAQRQAWAHVRNRLADAGMTDEQISREMNRWAQTDYADDFVFELSPQLTDDAAELAQQPTNRPAQAGRQAVQERQRATTGRVREATREGLGDDGSGFTATRDELESARAAEEGPLWDAFRGSEPLRRGGSVVQTADDLEAALRQRGVQVSLSSRNGVLTVNRIVVPEAQRGQGVGTQAMQEITDFADRNGLTVALTPSGDFGGSVSRLRQFYGRQGFVNNRGSSRDFRTQESMLREPRAASGGARTASPTAATHAAFTDLLRQSPRARRVTGRVLNALRERGQIDGALERALREAAQGNAEMLESMEIPPAVLDQYRRELSSIAQAASRRGDNAAADTAMQPVLRIRRMLEEAYPDTFSPAIRRSAELRSDIDALEIGYDLLRGAQNRRMPENVTEYVANLTPNQRALFRRGVARGIIEQAMEGSSGGIQAGGEFIEFGTTSNPISRFFRSDAQRELIRAAFGDEDRFARFANRMAREYQRSEAAGVMNFTRDNRQEAIIARRTAGGAAEDAFALAEGATGNPLPAIGRLVRAASAENTDEFNAELARILFATTNDPALQRQLEQQVRDEVTQRLVRSQARDAALAIAQGSSRVGAGASGQMLTADQRPQQ